MNSQIQDESGSPAGGVRKADPIVRSKPARVLHLYGYPLLALTRRDIARTYGKTVLGVSWMALQPALLLALYIFVFGFVLHVTVRPGSGPGEFALYLMSGMLPYVALADGIQRASTSLPDNRSLLNQAVFPSEVIPFAGVLGATFTEAVGLVIVVMVSFALGQTMTLSLLLLPVLVLLRVALTLGVACTVSVLTVFIPDLRELLGFLLTAWMFLTPIFYVQEGVPRGLQIFLQINPLYHLVLAYRAVIFAQPRTGYQVLVAAVWCLPMPWLGIWFFRSTLARAKDLL